VAWQQVKAIATLSRSRSPLMPDLRTAHEQGLADFDVVTWNVERSGNFSRWCFLQSKSF
jgi:tripartite-type tricarboxylate transporter receptor subunit TctC